MSAEDKSPKQETASSALIGSSAWFGKIFTPVVLKLDYCQAAHGRDAGNKSEDHQNKAKRKPLARIRVCNGGPIKYLLEHPSIDDDLSYVKECANQGGSGEAAPSYDHQPLITGSRRRNGVSEGDGQGECASAKGNYLVHKR